MIAPGILGWIVEALVASALLMAAVLLIRRPVQAAFGPQVAYALWALPALRLLLPPLPAEWTQAAALPIAQAGEVVAVLIVPATGEMPVAETAAALPWGLMIGAAWAAGAALFFASHWLRHRRFCARVLAEAKPVGEVGGIRVVESRAAAGPLAFGMAQRFVAFPRDFADRYDADERDLALAHELGHHQRGDLLANWVALVVLALHWFNPLAWRAFRAFRCDQELANDARVLVGRSRTDRHIYACAIIKAAHGGAVSPACHLHTIADLKGRLRMLTRNRPSRRRTATGAASVLALVTAGLAATASGTEVAAAVGERIEDVAVQMRAPAVIVPAAAPVAIRAEAPRAIKRIVVVKNGKTETYEGAAADAYAAENDLPIPPVPPMPTVAPLPSGAPFPHAAPLPPVPPMPPRGARAPFPFAGKKGAFSFYQRRDGRDSFATPVVSERLCVDGPDGEPRQLTVRRMDNGRSVTVICRNRIERVATESADAARRGMEARRHGLETALASIGTARESIRDNRNLTDEQRREALAGLEEAMAELRQEMAARD